jgi:hypothetical protein
MESESGRIIGTGEVADLVRGYDWSSTALGPIKAWSKELVTIVNLTLACPSPARTMWGAQLILIYNDAYRPIPVPRHPFALGKPAREVYSESWRVVGPLLEEALATGNTVFHEKLLIPLRAEDGVRDAYLNYSLQPDLRRWSDRRPVWFPSRCHWRGPGIPPSKFKDYTVRRLAGPTRAEGLRLSSRWATRHIPPYCIFRIDFEAGCLDMRCKADIFE